jgi:hypothetical protein
VPDRKADGLGDRTVAHRRLVEIGDEHVTVQGRRYDSQVRSGRPKGLPREAHVGQH